MDSVNDQNLKFQRRGVVIPDEPSIPSAVQQDSAIPQEAKDEKKNQEISEIPDEQDNQEVVDTTDVNAQQPAEPEAEKQHVETETPAEEIVSQDTIQPRE
jgi:hypothetical protein